MLMQIEFEKWMENEFGMSAEVLYLCRITDTDNVSGYCSSSSGDDQGLIMATSMWIAFQAARVLPEGYKLVPCTSTFKMDAAGSSYAKGECIELSYGHADGVWAAMVNEAQPPKSWIGEGNAN